MIRIVFAFWLALSAPALAQQGGAPQVPQGVPNPLFNQNFSGQSVFIAPSGGNSLIINMSNKGTGNADGSNAGPILYSLTTDPQSWPVSAERPIHFHDSLVMTQPTSNIWEGFDKFIFLSGAFTDSAEINNFHGFFNVASGSTSAQHETFESSTNVAGTITNHDDFLANPGVAFGGTITTLFSLECGGSNSGTVGTRACIDVEPLSGNAPTTDLAIRVNDSNAWMVSSGGLTLGTISPQTGSLLFIQGTDNASGTFPFAIKNLGGANVAFAGNDGQFYGNIVRAITNFSAGGTLGVISTTCTVTAGDTLTYTMGILTVKGSHCT